MSTVNDKSKFANRTISLPLKSKTTKAKAGKICSAIANLYPGATMSGRHGAYKIRFPTPAHDTKHLWLFLLIKDAKNLERK